MNQEHCSFEEKIAAANRSGEWSDELLSHLSACHICEEVALVSSYLSESAAASGSAATANLPDPAIIWSRAQFAARREAIERAMRPILWVRRFAFAVAAVVFVVAIVSFWPRITAVFAGFVETWTHQARTAQSGNNALFLLLAAGFLVLVPLIFGVYASWSED
jgi:hypothetical protein